MKPKASRRRQSQGRAKGGFQSFTSWWGFGDHKHSYYAGEIKKKSDIITCSFDRWLEPDCEPAIIAIPLLGIIHAFTNAGCWNNKSGKFKRCRDAGLFDEFPEDIQETKEPLDKLIVRMDCVRVLDNAVKALQEDSEAIAGDFSTVFKDLNTSLNDLQGTLNGPYSKTSSSFSFGESGSSSDVITGDLRSRINRRLARAKDRISRASGRFHTFERTFDFPTYADFAKKAKGCKK